MSEVWVAADVGNGRKLALKLVPRSEDNEALVQAARFGAELQQQIPDPRVVRVHEFGNVDDYFYIDMEYVPGSHIHKLLEDSKPIPSDVAIKVALEVCRTLVALENFKATIGGREIQSAVHGDLKPANIQVVGDLSGDFSVRILDFGTAKGLSMANPGGTRSPAFTPEYASPELLRTREMNQQSDRWALGATLYQMVLGRLPFGNGTSTERIEQAILEAAAPPPVNGVHPALNRILGRLLHPDIARRYKTARELLADLEKYPETAEASGYHGATRKADENSHSEGYRGETVRTSQAAPLAGAGRAAGSGDRHDRRTAPGIADPVKTNAGRGVVSRLVRLAIVLLLIFSSVWWVRAEYSLWGAARTLENDLKANSITAEQGLQRYTDLTNQRFSFLPDDLGIPQLIAQRFIERGDQIVVRFQREGIRIADFAGARSLYQKAQRLWPQNDEIQGRILLCDAHIARLDLGPTNDVMKTEEIARKYDEAATLLPESADPWLGKAMLYLYVAQNPERSEESLNQAASRSYPFKTSVRWVHLLASTYSQRALVLEDEASRLEDAGLQDVQVQARNRLRAAVANFEKAIQWYSEFPLHGTALKEIGTCRLWIERLNERLDRMQDTQ